VLNERGFEDKMEVGWLEADEGNLFVTGSPLTFYLLLPGLPLFY
jgi:hypothetical protein